MLQPRYRARFSEGPITMPPRFIVFECHAGICQQLRRVACATSATPNATEYCGIAESADSTATILISANRRRLVAGACFNSSSRAVLLISLAAKMMISIEAHLNIRRTGQPIFHVTRFHRDWASTSAKYTDSCHIFYKITSQQVFSPRRSV